MTEWLWLSCAESCARAIQLQKYVERGECKVCGTRLMAHCRLYVQLAMATVLLLSNSPARTLNEDLAGA